MTLIERSNALLEKIKTASQLPLALRAAQGVVLVPEAASLIFDLSVFVDRLEARVAALEKLVHHG